MPKTPTQKNADYTARLESIIGAAQLGIWDLNLETGVNYTNDYWWEMLGYKPGDKEYTFEFFMQLVHPDDQQIPYSTIADLEANQSDQFEILIRLQHKNGHYLYIEDIGEIVEWKDGKVARMIGSHRDVTKQIESNQELINAFNERENILEITDIGFISLDKELRIDYLNTAAKDIIGSTVLQLIHPHISKAFSPKLIPLLMSAIENCKLTAQSSAFEFHDIKTEKWLSFKVLCDETSYSLFIQDNTLSKLYHERMLESNIKAMENERNRISRQLHDGILQELTASMILAESIKHKSSDPVLKDTYTILSETLKHLSNETRRISHDLRALGLEDESLKDVLDKLVHNTNLSAKTNFEFHYKESKAPIIIGKHLKVNVFRIIQELLVNILKHAHASHALVSVSLIKNEIKIMVSDDGVGMKDINFIKPGVGLHNIKERLTSFHGEMTMERNINGGLTTTIKINTQ